MQECAINRQAKEEEEESQVSREEEREREKERKRLRCCNEAKLSGDVCVC